MSKFKKKFDRLSEEQLKIFRNKGYIFKISTDLICSDKYTSNEIKFCKKKNISLAELDKYKECYYEKDKRSLIGLLRKYKRKKEDWTDVFTFVEANYKKLK